ncbi:hypothetical protein ElyMa_002200500 [Elysia marginata]|uniref:MARVEL domain-containing protein n=1 Tax=Elysia marginata TaxID=1093978 RepID=A0AAV4FSK2_9GAST|nr:hypothetical protein ElyMa_002200500 [Elysia marginata]
MCEILGLIFTAIGVIYVIYVFNKEGRAAFKDLWFSIDFVALIFAFGSIAMFSTSMVNGFVALLDLCCPCYFDDDGGGDHDDNGDDNDGGNNGDGDLVMVVFGSSGEK